MGDFLDTAALDAGCERLHGYARAFQSLADTFRKMPVKKEQLSKEDVEEIFRDACESVCSGCNRRELCWGRNYYRTYRGLYGLLHAAETQEENQEEREFWETCRNPERVKTTVEDGFGRARLNLLWSNRLLETRAAMMEQLAQTADIMRNAARSIYDIRRLDGVKRYQVETGLRTHGLQMRDAWIYTRDDEWFELYLTLRTGRWSRCIPVKEAAWWLSGYFGQDLAPAYDSRMIINREFCTVCFTPEPEYVMLCGVARATREGEVISGDSFSMFRRDNGQMILGISDGMGSGPGACRESEQVIELLEQFLEAGFGKETAVRMIHAALMLQNNGSFSSVDLCTVNLFDGSCEFLKIGASTTFLKKADWVEAIVSTSAPIGIMEEVDFDCVRRQLSPGDYVIMVSDGVLDAMPEPGGEERMKELILEQESAGAGEIAGNLLEAVLSLRENPPEDDMTILVGGFWER